MNAQRRKALADIRSRLNDLIDEFDAVVFDEPPGNAAEALEQVGEALDSARTLFDDFADVHGGKKG